MDPVFVLNQHLQLCSQVYELSLEENTCQKTENLSPPGFIDKTDSPTST